MSEFINLVCWNLKEYGVSFRKLKPRHCRIMKRRKCGRDWSYCLLLSSAELVNEWSYTCTPPTWPHDMNGDNIAFYHFVDHSPDLLYTSVAQKVSCLQNINLYSGICVLTRHKNRSDLTVQPYCHLCAHRPCDSWGFCHLFFDLVSV